MRWAKKLKDREFRRYSILMFLAKKRKSPDEILNHGYDLGYSKGFRDGLDQGYADRIRDEEKRRA